MAEPRAFAYSSCFYLTVALICFSFATPSQAWGQASGELCTPGKPAKLFPRFKSKAFYFKLKSNDVIQLVRQENRHFKALRQPQKG